MELEISFAHPYLEKGHIMELQANDLNDFYASANEIDRLNLFFVLLNTLHSFGEDLNPERKAHR